MNCVNLVGRLTKDVDLRQNGDSSVARFTIAVDRKFKNAEGHYDADFIPCVSFGKNADFIAKYFSKGMKIGITGHIQTGSYTNKDGQKVYTTDVIVDSSEFIESKGSAPTEVHTQTSAPQINEEEGFMTLPNELESELPFM